MFLQQWGGGEKFFAGLRRPIHHDRNVRLCERKGLTGVVESREGHVWAGCPLYPVAISGKDKGGVAGDGRQYRATRCLKKADTPGKSGVSWGISYWVTYWVSGLMRSSTRRFCWRPYSVLLSAMGELSPRPTALIREGSTPYWVRAFLTLSARRTERV